MALSRTEPSGAHRSATRAVSHAIAGATSEAVVAEADAIEIVADAVVEAASAEAVVARPDHRRQGRDLPPSKYAAPHGQHSQSRQLRDSSESQATSAPADENYEPILLPGESLAKYRERGAAAKPAATPDASSAPGPIVEHGASGLMSPAPSSRRGYRRERCDTFLAGVALHLPAADEPSRIRAPEISER